MIARITPARKHLHPRFPEIVAASFSNIWCLRQAERIIRRGGPAGLVTYFRQFAQRYAETVDALQTWGAER